MPELHQAFAAALESQRDALNAAFALRQRAGARIDPSEFLVHLQTRVSPIVASVHSLFPERTSGVVAALYEVSLELFAASWLGPEARSPIINRMWEQLLPHTAALLARHPQQVAACLSNAAVQVASQTGTRPQAWLARMCEVTPQCDSLERLLDAGLVAAWQAGLAQFRAAALTAAGRLPSALAISALGVPENASAPVAEIVARMSSNPWLTAAAACEPTPARAGINLVATVGAFVGFGGVFLRPPLVEQVEGRIVCTDGVGQWQLLADAYGAWFRPMLAKEKSVKSSPQAQIDRQGTIRWGEVSIKLPHLATANSLAGNDATLALTLPTSHQIFLLGKTDSTA